MIPFIGVVLSLDHTFGAASKASIVAAKKGERTKPMKGGLLNVINENSEYVSWVSTIQFHCLVC